MENVMSKEIMPKWEVVLNNKSTIRSLATEQGSSLAKEVSIAGLNSEKFQSYHFKT